MISCQLWRLLLIHENLAWSGSILFAYSLHTLSPENESFIHVCSSIRITCNETLFFIITGFPIPLSGIRAPWLCFSWCLPLFTYVKSHAVMSQYNADFISLKQREGFWCCMQIKIYCLCYDNVWTILWFTASSLFLNFGFFFCVFFWS